MTATRAPGRVVMFVMNAVTHDSRVLREAATLRDAGWAVTIVGRLPSGATEVAAAETNDGIEIIRVASPGGWRQAWHARLAFLRYPWRARGEVVGSFRADARRGAAGVPRIVGRLGALVLAVPWTGYRLVDKYALGDRLPTPRRDGALEWLLWWRNTSRGWAKSAVESAPLADVYHGHDLTGLAAAQRAARTRRARLVYDSHEIFLAAGPSAARPWWARSLVGAVERRWARRADVLITVNDALAEHLGKQFGGRRFVVLHNCPPRWTAGPPVARLRASAGVEPSTPVVLFHGRLSADRGIEQLADAMLEDGLATAHLVLLGYGPLEQDLAELAREPRFGGRIHLVAAVPPDELLDWIVEADVDALPILPSTLNHRLSTPNKLFESIAAGVPVVVSNFPVMGGIVLGDPAGPLGAVCDPSSPPSIAAALRSILDLPADERARLRERCREAAAARWNWETESIGLLGAYEELAPPHAAG